LLPDLALLTLVLSGLVMVARFNRLLQALLAQLLGKDMIGALRTARGARRPQALPSQE